MTMADYLPKYTIGAAVTFTASTTIIGGRLVAVAGHHLVAPAASDSASVVGVAAFDVVVGDPVTVYMRPSGVQRLTASGPIAAGAKVAADASGKVQTIAGLLNPIGVALETATTNLDVIDVLFI